MATPSITPPGNKESLTLLNLTNELASVSEWYLLGVQLGVQPGQLDAIGALSASVDEKRAKMLHVWLKNSLGASWQDVVKALKGIREVCLAETIEKQHPASSGGTPHFSPTSSTPLNIPLTEDRQMTESVEQIEVTKRNLAKIRGKFGALLGFVCAKLQKMLTGKDVKGKFWLFLLTTFDIAKQCIPHSSDLEEIFEAITSHGLWDYQNYYPLEQITEEFGEKDLELIERMEQYKKDLSGFLFTTKIKDYIPAAKLLDKDKQTHIKRNSQYYRRLSVKLEQHVGEYSLKYLENLWKSLSYRLLLPPPSVLLDAVFKQSIVVVWLIPMAVSHQVVEKARQSTQFFQEHLILSVTIEDICVYTYQTVRNSVKTDPVVETMEENTELITEATGENKEQMVEDTEEAMDQTEQDTGKTDPSKEDTETGTDVIIETTLAKTTLLQEQAIKDLSWQKCTNVPEKMLRGTAVSDGKVAYFNSELSTKIYAYNSDTQQWSRLPDCPFSWSSLVIAQDMLTTVGGVLGYEPTNSLCSLTGEGSDCKWSAHFSEMPTKRWWVTAVGRMQSLIVAGGFDGRNRLSTVEVMDTDTQQWYNVHSLPHPFYSATAAICEDRLYLLGGIDENGVPTLSTLTCSISELLQPLTLQRKLKTAEQPTVWYHVADAPYYASTCASLCGQLITIGGREADNEATAVCAYNDKTNSWQVITDMPTARRTALVAILLGNRIMVVGGVVGGLTGPKLNVVEMATVS